MSKALACGAGPWGMRLSTLGRGNESLNTNLKAISSRVCIDDVAMEPTAVTNADAVGACPFADGSCVDRAAAIWTIGVRGFVRTLFWGRRRCPFSHQLWLDVFEIDHEVGRVDKACARGLGGAGFCAGEATVSDEHRGLARDGTRQANAKVFGTRLKLGALARVAAGEGDAITDP